MLFFCSNVIFQAYLSAVAQKYQPLIFVTPIFKSQIILKVPPKALIIITVYNEYFYLVILSVSQLNLVKCPSSSELYGDMLSLHLSLLSLSGYRSDFS